MKEKNETILELIKNKCYITDTSDLIKKRINTIIEDATIKVLEMIGVTEYDFSQSGKERELFLNYCFYMWNDKSIKDFEDNYLSDICKLRAFYEVKAEKEMNNVEKL